MYTYMYGGKQGTKHHVEVADDLIVVRTKDCKGLDEAVKSKRGKNILSRLLPIARFHEAGVTVLQCKHAKNHLLQLRDQARSQFKKEEDVRFAGRVLQDDGIGAPVVYTENFFVKFRDGLSAAKCTKLLKKRDLQVKKKLKYATNAYFVSAPEGTGLRIFQIALDLLDEGDIDLCHPELIRKVARRTIGPNQWHLQKVTVDGATINAHVNVKGAWNITKGEGTVIAIIDDGVDTEHEEFEGADKIVHSRDVTEGTNDSRPKDRYYAENHGTACAGVACAKGKHQASGVAPEAKLMPIRLVSNLGSQAEADSFEWATDHNADVISCSWGPADGDWWNPNDATHNQMIDLPDSTRLAIDYAVRTGRNGKGCVITWAAGNGNENVENDGYASYDKVIAVAACNDSNTRSVYSDMGESIWCAFPSSDFGYEPFGHPKPQTPGIWTTDREGEAGYNPGLINPGSTPPGDDHGNYTEDFGGTSSACPGVAGLAALALSANPDLGWTQVKNILRQACMKIDVQGGSYDNEGHSPFYGYGRPNATKVVELARNGTDIPCKELVLGATASGHLDATGAEKLFAVNLAAPAEVVLDGPGGVDFDLYVRKGSAPTTSDYDQRSYTPGPDEKLAIESDALGRYYILVRSYRGSGEFTLKVELS
ncbi:MAG: S8 family serine peptidase [Planctomycetes bacterium]|nr:S8 family serine peptidase [Planctomycetota bacterium]